MRKLVLIIAFLLLCSSLLAEDLRFACSFRVEDEQTGALVVSGKAYVQGECYRCETAEGAMYCDGKNRWIYYSESDELVIQDNDLSMFSGLDFNSISPGKCSYKFKNFIISLSEIKTVTEPWSATFFIIDPASFGENTIITDLR